MDLGKKLIVNGKPNSSYSLNACTQFIQFLILPPTRARKETTTCDISKLSEAVIISGRPNTKHKMTNMRRMCDTKTSLQMIEKR